MKTAHLLVITFILFLLSFFVPLLFFPSLIASLIISWVIIFKKESGWSLTLAKIVLIIMPLVLALIFFVSPLGGFKDISGPAGSIYLFFLGLILTFGYFIIFHKRTSRNRTFLSILGIISILIFLVICAWLTLAYMVGF